MQFHLRAITADETKYYYVLAALDQETVNRLLDLIANPPVENKYTALKERLTVTLGLSKRERVSRLLHFRPLGDTKPSALMDEMLALLGDHSPCFLFEQLFLERLPEDIRIQLVDIKTENLRELAQQADALWQCRDMESINGIQRRRTRPSNQRRPRPTAPPRFPDTSNRGDLCYYHRTYGEAARQCRQPCKWMAENDQASR